MSFFLSVRSESSRVVPSVLMVSPVEELLYELTELNGTWNIFLARFAS